MEPSTFYIISTVSVILIAYKTVLEIEKLLYERKKRKEEQKDKQKDSIAPKSSQDER
ncbi:hypothetical protein [Brevibacillus gelatini]|uniref:hypothetical protein n=1 Tax=Brevibacillus gelatini TaxID=1655277 RepID=UPI001474BE6B|nr:hypothetical protein [Brevibacillus gelatini]